MAQRSQGHIGLYQRGLEPRAMTGYNPNFPDFSGEAGLDAEGNIIRVNAFMGRWPGGTVHRPQLRMDEGRSRIEIGVDGQIPMTRLRVEGELGSLMVRGVDGETEVCLEDNADATLATSYLQGLLGRAGVVNVGSEPLASDAQA